MPSTQQSYEQTAEVIARYVSHSVLAIAIHLIDRGVLRSWRAAQRDGVARAGARMFEISRAQSSMTKVIGNPDHAALRVDSAWLTPNNDIVALDVPV
jgi:hypothetical protein